jgi:photosynthetic reaction center cytochrome c subunit
LTLLANDLYTPPELVITLRIVKGDTMKFCPGRLFVALAGAAVVALVSAALFASGAKVATGQSSAASVQASHDSAVSSVLSMSGINVFALTSVQAGAGQAGQAGQRQMSEQAFKNIQVLKGIPVDEFMGTMGLFSAALSVCCGDCHTGAGTSNPKWDDDPPRKRTARNMIQMVTTLNRTNFGGRPVVTCWTCHRGQQRPAATPPLDRIYGEPVIDPPDILPTASSGVPTADQIFDKYVQAVGGASRLASLTSYAGKGTSIGFGEVGSGDPAELYAKAPNQLATVVHQREGDLARTFDGTNGYFMLPLTVVEVYPWTGGALEGVKLEAEMAFPGRIKDLLGNWRVSYPITLDSREVYVVQGTGPEGLVGTFYFDKETGLLSRMIRYYTSSVGRVPTQIDYSDYRPVAGVMLPFKWSYGWVSGREEYTWTDIQPNVSVDAAKFARPVPRSR